MVTPEWFELQYADPSREVNVAITSNFRIDWHTLNILRKESMVSLGIKQGGKRIPIYDKDNIWKDTDPIDIEDLSSLDNMGKLIVNSLRKQRRKLLNEKNILISKLSKEGDKHHNFKEGEKYDKKNDTLKKKEEYEAEFLFLRTPANPRLRYS